MTGRHIKGWESIYSFLTAWHLNGALAPDLQFDTLELRNPPVAAWPESHHSHVHVVRETVKFEAGDQKLHTWRCRSVASG